MEKEIFTCDGSLQLVCECANRRDEIRGARPPRPVHDRLRTNVGIAVDSSAVPLLREARRRQSKPVDLSALRNRAPSWHQRSDADTSNLVSRVEPKPSARDGGPGQRPAVGARGKRTVKTVPRSSVDSTAIVPSWARTISRVM